MNKLLLFIIIMAIATMAHSIRQPLLTFIESKTLLQSGLPTFLFSQDRLLYFQKPYVSQQIYILRKCTSQQDSRMCSTLQVTLFKSELSNQIKSIKQIKIGDQYFWLFILNNGLCIEQANTIYNKSTICLNQSRNCTLDILVKQLQNQAHVFAITNDFKFTKLILYPNKSIIQSQMIFPLQKPQYQNSLLVVPHRQFICIYNKQSYILDCYNFQQGKKSFSVKTGFKQYEINFQENEIIVKTPDKINKKIMSFFRIHYYMNENKLETIKEELTSKQIINKSISVAYQNLFDFNKISLTQTDTSKYDLYSQFYFISSMIWQKSLFIVQVFQLKYQSQQYKKIGSNQTHLIMYMKVNNGSSYQQQKILVIKDQSKFEDDISVFIIFIALFSTITLALSVLSLLKYKIQLMFYLKQMKIAIISEAVALVGTYSILISILITIDIHDTQAIKVKKYLNKQPYSSEFLDSCLSRILYYFFQSTSIISCLHIIFSHDKINNSFAQLLSKHKFKLWLLNINHLLMVTLKLYICSAFSILFMFITQQVCQTPFSIFAQVTSLRNSDITILVSGFICLLSLSALTFIIIELSQTYMYRLSLILLLIGFMSFISEYVYLLELLDGQMRIMEKILVFSLPLCTFQTIIESLLRTKPKYAQIHANQIEDFKAALIVQMLVLWILAMILCAKRIKRQSLSALIKPKQQTASSILSSHLQSKDSTLRSLTQNLSIEDSDAIPLLNVYIPCKIRTYSGIFKKKVLQNIVFKGYKNQVISFIDYQNESKSALLKILINEEKSDLYIEQDLKGEIFYSKQISLGFCTDKNIVCQEMNFKEHLQLFLGLKKRNISKDQMKEEVQFMLDQFNIIDEDSIKEVKALSGGNKKKLCLACAFIGDPDVVILNDPTIGLDTRFKRIFWQKIKEWKQNKLIIVGTSDSEEAEVISDKIWIIENGKMHDYMAYQSIKYFGLSLDFFKQQQFDFCKQLIEDQFPQPYHLKSQKFSKDIFQYKLQIYEIDNHKNLDKIGSLIRLLNRKYQKDYYFYFKTHESKFTYEEFYKFNRILANKTTERPEEVMFEKLHSMIMKYFITSQNLTQAYKMEQKQSYYEEEAKKMILELSAIPVQLKNVYWSQLKSVFYHRLSHIKNKSLYIQLIAVNLYFWYTITLNAIIYRQKFQQGSNYFIRMIPMYCFLMISTQFNTLTIDAERQLLLNIGMNYKILLLGQWLFRVFYINACLLINLAIYWFTLYSIDPQNPCLNSLYMLPIASLLFAMNYTIYTLVILAISQSKQITILVEFVLIVLPLYVKNNIFFLQYAKISLELQQLLEYLFFPVSFQSLCLSMQSNMIQVRFIWILVYQMTIPMIIAVIYEKITQYILKSKKKQFGLIDNVASDAIIQSMGEVDDLFDNDSVVIGHNICKKYRKQSRKQPSLRNLYLHCKKGQLLMVVGHNGCGKTTLFDIISNKIRKTYGKIQIFGKSQESITFRDKINYSYCTQIGELLEDYTLQQNIRFVGLLKRLDDKHVTRFMIKMIRYFKLDNKERALISQLSQGERKKLSILLSFLGSPSFLIFDEPTSCLDSQLKAKVMYFMKHYCKINESAIMITTHNIKEAEKHSDRVTILKKGYLLKTGAPQVLIKDPSQQLYRLIIFFKYASDKNLVKVNQEKVILFMSPFSFIKRINEKGLRFIYGLDLFKIDMHTILSKMLFFFKQNIIEKFDLYKYDLEEVVKYSMSTQSTREEQKEKKGINKSSQNS